MNLEEMVAERRIQMGRVKSLDEAIKDERRRKSYEKRNSKYDELRAENTRLKCLFSLLAMDEGKTYKEIAKILDRDPTRVRSYIQRQLRIFDREAMMEDE